MLDVEDGRLNLNFLHPNILRYSHMDNPLESIIEVNHGRIICIIHESGYGDWPGLNIRVRPSDHF